MLFLVDVYEVILILFLANLAIVGVGSCYFDVILIFSLFSLQVHFKVSFNFFSELKSLESLVLNKILLC